MILGWCVGHYTRWARTGDVGAAEIRAPRVKIPAGAECSVGGCGRPESSRGWCKQHYSRWERHGDVQADIPIAPAAERTRKPKPPPRQVRLCDVDDCGDKHYIGGHCIRHHYRAERYGDPLGGEYLYSELVRSTRHLPIVERFWARVDKDGPVPANRPDLGPCWVWGASLNGNGYGQTFSFPDVGNLAHRVAWHLSGRTLIAGLELDHLCRTPACVRPEHVEQVPKIVNIMRGNGYSARNRRKTHCSNGHAFTPDNTVVLANGHRRCRPCRNTTFRLRQERRGMDRRDLELSAAYKLAITADPCWYCGGPGEQFEHFFPVSKGGNSIWANLVRACGPCNRSKGPRCGTWFVLRNLTLRNATGLIAAANP